MGALSSESISRPHSARVAALALSLGLPGLVGACADGGSDVTPDAGVDAGRVDAGGRVDAATTTDAGDLDEGIADAGDAPDANAPDAGFTCQTNGFCRMFVAGPFTGSSFAFGGVTGMDAACNADPNRPDTSVTYAALIADGTTRVACTTASCSTGAQEHVDWVLEPSREYRRAEGTTVIGTTTPAGVFAFPLDAAISTDIVGTNSTLTGLLGDWVSSTNHCSGWTTSAASSQVGLHDETSSSLLSIGTAGCSNTFRLICVEQ